MVKALLKVVVVIAVVWSGYWAVSAYGVRSAITGWFSAQQTRGWQAEYASISTGGFPFWHETQLTAPALADPNTGIAWRADHLTLINLAVWPGHVVITFPDTQQLFSSLDQTLALTAVQMQTDLKLKPGTALELDEMALTAKRWAITAPKGALIQADQFEISALRSPNTNKYKLMLSAPKFAPGAALRKSLHIPPDWPLIFDALSVEMDVTFDKPWDRSALEISRPQPRVIDLGLAEARWGALRLYAAGQLTIDEAGTPTGALDIRAENWRDLLNLAQNSGALHADLRSALEQALNLLARMGRDPDILDVKLSFQNGYINVGFVPIGPAPRLILR